MQVKTEKKKINLNKCCINENVSEWIEQDIIVPDTKPDALKILHVNVTPYVSDVEITENRLKVIGKLNYFVIYRVDDDKFNARGLIVSYPFTKNLEVSGITKDMCVTVVPKTKNIIYALPNERKISVKSEICFCVTAKSTKPVEVITSFDPDAMVECKMTKGNFNNIMQHKKSIIASKDDVMLPKDAEDFFEILDLNTRIINTEFKQSYNKIMVKGDIEIMPLTKTEYIEALKSMEIDGARAQELFVFSHGNLRSLIRRIPGNNIERIPDWGKQDNIQLLAPVVFLRNIDVETDKEMIMNLSGSSFINVMDNYQKLLKLEDSPIKQVNNKYVIVNYEEAWDVLELSVNDYHFEFLIKEINRLLDEISKNGMYCIRRKSSHDIKELFYNLFLNFVYYSYEDDQNKKVDRAIESLLSRATEPNLNSIIIENLSILAEAAPNVVMNFMEFDITQKDSLIINVFEDMDYDHLYCRILSALEELARYSFMLTKEFRVVSKIRKECKWNSNYYSENVDNYKNDPKIRENRCNVDR